MALRTDLEDGPAGIHNGETKRIVVPGQPGFADYIEGERDKPTGQKRAESPQTEQAAAAKPGADGQMGAFLASYVATKEGLSQGTIQHDLANLGQSAAAATAVAAHAATVAATRDSLETPALAVASNAEVHVTAAPATIAHNSAQEYPMRTHFHDVPEDEQKLVREAQASLKALGHNLDPDGKFQNGGIDGLNGDVTSKEVRKFKEDHGITPSDGTVTEVLVAKLKEAEAAKIQAAALSTSPVTAVAPSTPEQQAALAMSPESASMIAPAYGLSAATQEALKQDHENHVAPAFGLSAATLAQMKAAVEGFSNHAVNGVAQGTHDKENSPPPAVRAEQKAAAIMDLG